MEEEIDAVIDLIRLSENLEARVGIALCEIRNLKMTIETSETGPEPYRICKVLESIEKTLEGENV